MHEFYPIAIEEVETQAMRDRKERRRLRFVRLPMVWADRLNEIGSAVAYRVAIYLLQRAWLGATVTVPRINRVSRNGKRVALRALEGAGLVSVKWRARKSPVVTILSIE